MSTHRTSCYLLIILTIIIAVLLSLIAFPLEYPNLVPSFLPVVILFWAIVEPQKVNVGVAWLSGLILDFAFGSTLGIHAASTAFMVWGLVTFFENIRFYSFLQKSIVVISINVLGQFLLFWTEHIFGTVTIEYNVLLSSLATAIIWPICYGILNAIYSFFCPIHREEDY